MREVLGAALLSLGFSLNSKDPAELAEARDVAIRWKKNIAKFENEQYKTGIASGEFYLVQGYAGDLLQVAEENEDIVVKIPKEGTAFPVTTSASRPAPRKSDSPTSSSTSSPSPPTPPLNMEYIAFRAPNSGAYPLLSEDFRGSDALFPTRRSLRQVRTDRRSWRRAGALVEDVGRGEGGLLTFRVGQAAGAPGS